MVISCLTVYAIAFSCFTLLIGKSFAATSVQSDITVRPNDRKGNKIYFNAGVKRSPPPDASSKPGEKYARPTKKLKLFQSSFIPSGSATLNEANVSGRDPKESHSYFAFFDTDNNDSKVLFLPGTNFSFISGSRVNDYVKNRSVKSVGSEMHRRLCSDSRMGETESRKKPNLIVWDVLRDSEYEVRIHYNGMTAKETVVATGFDRETGKKQGLRLRQLTDGRNFIQLIYTFDDRIQDCEYLKEKHAVKKFVNAFWSDVRKAREAHEWKAVEGDDVHFHGDEGELENYPSESEELEEGDSDFGSAYRNVTFRIIRREKDLPRELAEWMNYPILKRKCSDNHKILKALTFDRRHGSEKAKKLAEEHIERVKRGFDLSLIFPGTNWCGKSSTAEKYTQLGGFYKTDKCCRAHDHCHPLIKAFETKYHFYNFRPFTISHCRCDLRRKRDIMDVLLVPGTKWCGKGRRATKYTSLGGFSRTDKCCRVHDTMCPHWIGSLEEKYGLFNWRINTIMHCRCDKRFRACLKMAKTGTANFVGKLFFNVVQTKCFVLKPKEVCLKYSWWGKCEKKEYRKQAHLKDNLSY